MKRQTSMKRGGQLRPISAKRSRDNREYGVMEESFLAAHPYCQAAIFIHGLDENEVIAAGGILPFGFRVPRSTEIHHRNKRRKSRLVDTRFAMAVCRERHQWIEDHKSEARALGLLFPVQADADGKWGNGQQGLTTDELLASRVMMQWVHW